jgi:hypothetical protein
MVSNNNKARVHALALVAAVAAAMATLSACGGGSNSADVPPPTVQPLSAAAVAGEALFNDKSLSASGQPAVLDANVNAGEVPYTAPKDVGGNAPTLNAQEIDDLVAFLCTLTDGFDPNNPSAYNVPVQCQPKESVP